DRLECPTQLLVGQAGLEGIGVGQVVAVAVREPPDAQLLRLVLGGRLDPELPHLPRPRRHPPPGPVLECRLGLRFLLRHNSSGSSARPSGISYPSSVSSSVTSSPTTSGSPSPYSSTCMSSPASSSPVQVMVSSVSAATWSKVINPSRYSSST